MREPHLPSASMWLQRALGPLGWRRPEPLPGFPARQTDPGKVSPNGNPSPAASLGYGPRCRYSSLPQTDGIRNSGGRGRPSKLGFYRPPRDADAGCSLRPGAVRCELLKARPHLLPPCLRLPQWYPGMGLAKPWAKGRRDKRSEVSTTLVLCTHCGFSMLRSGSERPSHLPGDTQLIHSVAGVGALPGPPAPALCTGVYRPVEKPCGNPWRAEWVEQRASQTPVA